MYSSFILRKVTELEAEYYPPKEDVIFQNEAPTDAYILVSGEVVSNLVDLNQTRKCKSLKKILLFAFAHT